MTTCPLPGLALRCLGSVLSLCFACTVSAASAAAPAAFTLSGDWEVRVALASGTSATVPVRPPEIVIVEAEKHAQLPLFSTNAGGWAKGAQLRGVQAQETTTPDLLDPASLVLRAGPEITSPAFERGTDYLADLRWGTIGRLPQGKIQEKQPVYASYRHGHLRLDTVVAAHDGSISLLRGQPASAAPLAPRAPPDAIALGHIWLPGRIARLGPEHLFPILEDRYPEPAKPTPSVAEAFVPRALQKLRNGEKLRLLAWGDSVTVGTYVPDPARERWQEQFVARLRERFPKANLELLTEAWGGRSTASYLGEPPGSPHHYGEKVLGVRPDLIVSEFVNDAGLNPAQVEERYSKLLEDFQRIGAEWIILTPHYVRPDWMGLDRERDIDADPRPYVAGLRRFAAGHHVALADAALRYGRLWRQGLPYTTFLLNSINHPDARGMKIFADALMELFP